MRFAWDHNKGRGSIEPRPFCLNRISGESMELVSQLLRSLAAGLQQPVWQCLRTTQPLNRYPLSRRRTRSKRLRRVQSSREAPRAMYVAGVDVVDPDRTSTIRRRHCRAGARAPLPSLASCPRIHHRYTADPSEQVEEGWRVPRLESRHHQSSIRPSPDQIPMGSNQLALSHWMPRVQPEHRSWSKI